jgi:hypothetical protein
LVIGAFSGGVVSYFLGAKAAYLINIGSFLGAGWIILTLPKTEQQTRPLLIKTENQEVTVAFLWFSPPLLS